MKMKKTIITVIGYDKPGIIASISETLFKEQCNIENISQTILQSQFAGIFIVLIPDNLSITKLSEIFQKNIPEKNISIKIELLETDKIVSSQKETEQFIVTTTGPDKQGLVAAISREIATFDVNISNLKAVFKGGDNPDKNVMIYEIDIPVDIDHHQFSDSLRKKASELGLELSIQHKNIFDMVNRI